MSTPRVVVVGGGVIGVSCAYFLAKRGIEVQLFERDRIAAGASRGNGGVVSAGHPPFNRPGRMRQLMASVLDSTSPAYVPPRWSPSLWKWLREFADRCTEEHVEACMRVMAPLGKDALALFDALMSEEGFDCGYSPKGYFEVCTTDAGIQRGKDEASILERFGYHPERATGEELRREEPAFGPELLGGIYYPEARTLDPIRFVSALSKRAVELGVDIREGVGVSGVSIVSGRVAGVLTLEGEVVGADAVVLATGPFSARLARKAGARVPVQPGKGYHRDYAVGPGGAPPIGASCVLSEAAVFCVPMDGRVRFAGTMEFAGVDRKLRPLRLEQLTLAGRTCFPELGYGKPTSEWCGLRPMSVDGLPIIGPLGGVEGLTVATGHGMLGVTLGPVTGEMVARHISGEGDSRLAAFSPNRFH